MRLPRGLHRLYAALTGYFWLPCPVCGREFGGHERGATSIPDPERGPGAGLIACSKHQADEPEFAR